MGGPPKKNTPADMRLKANKAKYGTVANRDAGRKPGASPASSRVTPSSPSAKKG